MKKKTGVIVLTGALLAGVIMIVYAKSIVALFGAMWESAPIEIYDNIDDYERYRSGEQAEKEFQSKWDMDESIWPESITEKMNVTDYKMVYYDPWDAQYLGYLVVEYPPDAYTAETQRLLDYPSTEYKGYYGVTGESDYKLLAVYADPYYGFVYAMTDEDNTIIYAEQIFCDYFMDLDYKKYVPEKYFLDGFDASSGNSYQKSKM